MTPDIPRTLPPDPSVPGLWWLRSGDWLRAWAWRPSLVPRWMGYWHTGDSAVLPDVAHAAGWRCVAAAVPPGWRNMASAPRDGTRVLLRFRDHHNALTVTAGEWNDWLYDVAVWELDGGESCDPWAGC